MGRKRERFEGSLAYPWVEKLFNYKFKFHINFPPLFLPSPQQHKLSLVPAYEIDDLSSQSGDLSQPQTPSDDVIYAGSVSPRHRSPRGPKTPTKPQQKQPPPNATTSAPHLSVPSTTSSASPHNHRRSSHSRSPAVVVSSSNHHLPSHRPPPSSSGRGASSGAHATPDRDGSSSSSKFGRSAPSAATAAAAAAPSAATATADAAEAAPYREGSRDRKSPAKPLASQSNDSIHNSRPQKQHQLSPKHRERRSSSAHRRPSSKEIYVDCEKKSGSGNKAPGSEEEPKARKQKRKERTVTPEVIDSPMSYRMDSAAAAVAGVDDLYTHSPRKRPRGRSRSRSRSPPPPAPASMSSSSSTASHHHSSSHHHHHSREHRSSGSHHRKSDRRRSRSGSRERRLASPYSREREQRRRSR